MLPFNEYKKLPVDTQEYSLSLWIDELLALTNNKNINQLADYLAKVFPEICEQKKNSKYLNKKGRGQLIKDDRYPLLLDEKLSGGANVLFSPLWALLEWDELSTAEAVKFASYLPFDIQKRLLSNDRRKIKGDVRALYKLTQLNTLDALTAALIIFLKNKSSLSDHLTYFINREITLLIFRLFLVRFKNYDVGYYLIQKLSLLFRSVDMPPNKNRAYFTIWENEKPNSIRMPMILSLVTSSDILHACCATSEYITNVAIARLELEDITSIRHQILNYLDHDNLDELTWNFYQIEKGSSLRVDAELWKLRGRLKA